MVDVWRLNFGQCNIVYNNVYSDSIIFVYLITHVLQYMSTYINNIDEMYNGSILFSYRKCTDKY